MNGSVAVDARADGLYVIGYSLTTAGFHTMSGFLRVLPVDATAVTIGTAVLDGLAAATVTERIPTRPYANPALMDLLNRAGVRTYPQYARGVRQVTVGKASGIGQNPLHPTGPIIVMPHDNLGPTEGFAALDDEAIEIEEVDATPAALGQAILIALLVARPGKHARTPPAYPTKPAPSSVAMTTGRVEVTSRDGLLYIASASFLTETVYVIESHQTMPEITDNDVIGRAVLAALAASRHHVPQPRRYPTPGQAKFLAATGYSTYAEFAQGARQVTAQHEFWDIRRPLIVTPYRNEGIEKGFVALSDQEVSIDPADVSERRLGEAVFSALQMST
jgi:hypothetical protein